MSVLRVATINVWNKSGPWLSRLPLIRRELERLAPEVVGLQEVLRFRPPAAPDAPLTTANDQLTEIADGLGYQLAYGVASDYGQRLEVRQCASCRAIRSSPSRASSLPGSESGETRSLLYALCQTPHGQSARVRHAPELEVSPRRRFASGKSRSSPSAWRELSPIGGPHLPPVLMGDFNAAPDADEIRFLTGLVRPRGQDRVLRGRLGVRR